MKTIFALMIVIGLAAKAARADEPKTEITVTTNPAPVASPPRACVDVKEGESLPVPRSDGDGVDMGACEKVGGDEQ